VKFHWFAEVTYGDLPADFPERHDSSWVDIPASLADPRRVGEHYRMFIRLMQQADRDGFAFRDALEPEGRMAVITYHSGEDRLVKHAFREWASACVCPPHQPVCTCRGRPLGKVEPRKPMVPTDEEMATNSRARSARLRIFRAHHAA
jgi:16S rRNA (cytosine1402-N4)-methyltransferase